MASSVKYKYDENGERMYDADGERIIDSANTPVETPSQSQVQAEPKPSSILDQIKSGVGKGFQQMRDVASGAGAVAAGLGTLAEYGAGSLVTGKNLNPIERAMEATSDFYNQGSKGEGLVGIATNPVNIASMTMPVAKAASLLGTAAKVALPQALTGAGSEFAEQTMKGQDIDGLRIAESGLLSGLIGGGLARGSQAFGKLADKGKKYIGEMAHEVGRAEQAQFTKEIADKKAEDIIKNAPIELDGRIAWMKDKIKRENIEAAEGMHKARPGLYTKLNLEAAKIRDVSDIEAYDQIRDYIKSSSLGLDRSDELIASAKSKIVEPPKLADGKGNLGKALTGGIAGGYLGGPIGAAIGAVGLPVASKLITAIDKTANRVAFNPKTIERAVPQYEGLASGLANLIRTSPAVGQAGTDKGRSEVRDILDKGKRIKERAELLRAITQ